MIKRDHEIFTLRIIRHCVYNKTPHNKIHYIIPFFISFCLQLKRSQFEYQLYNLNYIISRNREKIVIAIDNNTR